ncbi:YeaC family protein [Paraferrimonas haliotis]|uniref:DUF1315 family protein n=1 Tax=Paraferrimonas haliotis TaxID=2013866 RepID=A0AA37TTW9_9GAMM|nr:DUF1315 family protein [Paraferrimonas haliotis]GLS84387.1 hypothetical protein GCM10007894_23640 [Paraferrimonas haliotis]
MSELNKVIENMPHEVYLNLKQAVELGKWPDGSLLTEAQKESSMQAIILYQATRLQQTDHLMVGKDGQLNHKSKAQLKEQFSPDSIANFQEKDL